LTALSDEVLAFVSSSEFWKVNQSFLERGDVIHHELNLETSLHPLSLEFLFRTYLDLINRHVVSVGHAIVQDQAYIKLYTVERPIVNVVWQYNNSVTIGPQERWYTTWTDSDVEAYMTRVEPRPATPSDLESISEYFESTAWKDAEHKLLDDETEHFHVFVRTELDPFDLEEPFRQAVVRMGLQITAPAFYLAQSKDHPLAEPDREAMWLGLAPDGTKNFEVSCIYSPGVLLEPKQLSADELLYGGDGWTTSQYRAFVSKQPYEVLTLSEAQKIASVMADVKRSDDS